MKIKMLTVDNEPNLVPDDYFHKYSITVEAFLETKPPLLDVDDMAIQKWARDLGLRCRAYWEASELYLAFSEGRHRHEFLREPPRVIPEYNTQENSTSFVFVFKCENNGNTYRVRWERNDP